MKTRLLSALLLCLCAVVLPVSSAGLAAAGDTFEIRMATIAPKSSKPMRILRAWDATVREKTGGKVGFRFYAGGVAGDERDVIRKMKVQQLDATTLTSVGLSQIVRSASVLQVPGLFASYRALGAVRAEMDGEWRKEFDQSGYTLLGWFDIGFGRIFSTHPIAAPTDLKKARPWVWRDDAVFPELMKLVGANGVPLALPEVFPALQTKMVDTVIASPVAALGLQWFNNVQYMTKQADTALVGATLISNAQFKALPPDAQTVLIETGRLAHQKALELVESEEREAYEALKGRGIKEVDTAPHAAEWKKVYVELRQHLTGKLFPADLLARVVKAADSAK